MHYLLQLRERGQDPTPLKFGGQRFQPVPREWHYRPLSGPTSSVTREPHTVPWSLHEWGKKKKENGVTQETSGRHTKGYRGVTVRDMQHTTQLQVTHTTISGSLVHILH